MKYNIDKIVLEYTKQKLNSLNGKAIEAADFFNIINEDIRHKQGFWGDNITAGCFLAENKKTTHSKRLDLVAALIIEDYLAKKLQKSKTVQSQIIKSNTEYVILTDTIINNITADMAT